MQANDAPIACTLNLTEMQSRLAWIRQVTQDHLVSHNADGPTLRLVYRAGATQDLQRLVQLESACCAFLRFDLCIGPTESVLTITAPERVGDAAGWLFDQFVPEPQEPAATRSCGCQASKCCG